MSVMTATVSRPGLFRQSRWDALLVGLALAQGVLLVALPSAILIALGVWWNSNTVAHNFIHTPYFRSRTLNRLFALYQSVLLGVPQSIWRGRHLAHHAGVRWRPMFSVQLTVEVAAVLTLWGLLLLFAPWFLLTAYLPGYVAGLVLCALHGHYEHAHGTISHYGTLYNFVFFNDGYHVEHHAHPGTHWTRLRHAVEPGASASRWPAFLRWLDCFSLEGLERLVLRSARLQRFVLHRHERAFTRLLPHFETAKRIGIIGGGLFPRTALILRRLLPDARLTVIDANPQNVQTARSKLDGDVEFICDWFDARRHGDFDLLIVPLAYVGDRTAFYRAPPAQKVLVHDWLWRRRRPTAIVSFLLAKRVNLVLR